jgi:hypothetical protein
LRDVYTAKTEELEPYASAFEAVPHQRGSLVFINGQPVGLDLISREGAYAAAHPKLVKSYAIDALVGSKDGFDAPSLEKASVFLNEVQGCEERVFPSIALKGTRSSVRGWCLRRALSISPSSDLT